MIFGKQRCKWTLIILANLICYRSPTSLTWWRNAIMLTSMKSCLSPTKINISLKFCIKKTLNYRKFMRKFPNKNWNRHGLDHVIKKIDW